MLIFFEHGITSIRDYLLIEILAEIIHESLEDYLQTIGHSHFTCNGMLNNSNDFSYAYYINSNISHASRYLWYYFPSN